MSTIEEIKSPIAKEIKEFEQKFRVSMKSSVPLLDRITFYIVNRKGKQIRPLFVFFSAELCGGISETTYRAAALVELLHTATLVHDDVVDDAFERRGFFSINALWKNKIAVLVGDYLLSKGLLLSLNNDDFNLLKIVSDSVKKMSEGELLQIEKARKLDIKEEVYYEIIKNKTASLIASCCACGAASANASSETVEQLRLFGEKIGISFQIRDDLFDFGSENTGKPNGIDIKGKKITLPLIYALNNSSYLERRKIINLIKNLNSNNNDVRQVVDFVYKKGGIDYATKIMQNYYTDAMSILKSFPEVAARQSLEKLVKFTIERGK